jgi:plasminogen activator inhibitor 1 RNA-binding protein
VKPVEKRDGNGAYNWGTFKDDLEETMTTTTATTEPAQTEEGNAPGADAEVNEQAETAATEENAAQEGTDEDNQKTMTLDEWRAMQAKPKNDFNIRKPNEGTDDSQWKKTYILKKKEVPQHEEEEVEEDDEEEEYEDPRKRTLNIEITFNDPIRRGGRGRGRGRGGPPNRGPREGGPPNRGPREGGPSDRGTGGGRSRGGSGMGRGSSRGRGGYNRNADKVPNVSSDMDFPALPALAVTQS